MSETKNHLGLDKFQVTVVKNNYNTIKPALKVMEKAQAKIDAAKAKYEETLQSVQKEMTVYKEQISLLDQYVINMTTKSCGIGLTTEQAIKYLEDADAFEAYKKSLGMVDMFEDAPNAEPANTIFKDPAKDLDSEEDRDWEEKIEAGEVKEIV